MGLDNGIVVKSNRRKLTRVDLPNGIKYPFSESLDGDSPEICYWRKCWGIRDDILLEIEGDIDGNDYYSIDTPEKIVNIIRILANYLDKDFWDEYAHSIWEYEDMKENLQNQIINLALIAAFMSENPDVYCVFYDSY